MPEFRNLDVRVVDKDGDELQEWGVQHLHSQNKISTYIKSSTNVTFRVTVQPRLPFHSPDLPMACDVGSAMGDALPLGNDDGRSRGTEDFISGHPKEFLKHQRVGSAQTDRTNHGKARGCAAEKLSITRPPVRTNEEDTSALPPYHFLASLFLDGRQKADRQAIVYLDPLDDDFASPYGKIKLQSRWVEGNDGNLQEIMWVFKDVGIETAFDQMLIDNCRDDTSHKEQDEEAMIAAMSATVLGAEVGLRKDEESGVGQIVVVIQRVILGKKWVQNIWKAPHKEGEVNDVQMGGAVKDVSHTTGFEHVRTIPPRSMRVAGFTFCDRGEKPYATFQFFYRSQETLEKFGFPGFPRRSVDLPKRFRHIEDQMASVTPLSLTHPLPPLKRKGRTFEESIKGKNIRTGEPGSPTFAPLPKRKQTLPKSSKTPEESRPRSEGSSVVELNHRRIYKEDVLQKLTASTNSQTTQSDLHFGPGNAIPSSRDDPCNLATIDFNPPSTKSLVELVEISKEEYRASSQASDADDERDESDLETVIGCDDEPFDTDNHFKDKENIPPTRTYQDDQGLSVELQDKLSVKGQKHRDGRYGLQSGEKGSVTKSTSVDKHETKNNVISLISPPGSPLSGVGEDADEEDNGATRQMPVRLERSKKE